MATSSNKKILLFILGTLVLIAIAVVGGGYWWFKYKSADYFKDAQAAYIEARKAGAGMTEQGCYDRATAALKTPEGSSFKGSIRNGLALNGCLQSSQPVGTFCDDVPKYGEILAGAAWESKTCAALGADQQYCGHMVREVSKYCASPVRAAKLARAARGSPAAGGAGETK